MNIVLVNPEIPQNTGNIARTCAATGTALHLIEPLGFKIEDRYLKRAGLDYWHLTTLHVHKSWRAFREACEGASLYFLTTKAQRRYCDMAYQSNDFLVFGRETKGLPEDMLTCHAERCVRIPMLTEARSLNLSNAVALVLYEALRQQGFEGLNAEGALHGTGSGNCQEYL